MLLTILMLPQTVCVCVCHVVYCRECVLGLGEALMKEASGILHQQEPEEAEVE